MSDTELLETMRNRDPRVQRIGLMVEIEAELRDSKALRLVLEMARIEAGEAKERLTFADPVNPAEIYRLQQKVRLPDFIQSVIDTVLENGRAAVDELNAEAQEMESE